MGQAEFELIQKAKLVADRHLVFPDKASLYRSEEEPEKVVVLRWWRIAAAAVVFLFLSGTGWYIISTNKPNNPVVAKNEPTKTNTSEQNILVKPNETKETVVVVMVE